MNYNKAPVSLEAVTDKPYFRILFYIINILS